MNIITYRTFFISILLSIIIFSCKKTDNEKNSTAPHQTLNTYISTNINFEATMKAGKTYYIDGTIYVDGVTLTIEPGVTLKFDKNSSLVFGFHEKNSRLIANGTSNNPIIFTSNEYHPAEGDWSNIKFTSGTSNNSYMKYCKIMYAGGLSGENRAAIDINGCAVTIENCTIDYSNNRGIDLDNNSKFNSFTGNTISHCKNEAISVYVNSAHTIGVNNKITDSPILVKGGDYNQEYSHKWKYQQVPYIIDGIINIYSSPGSKLTIDAGNTIKFTKESRICIGTNGVSGTIVADGTPDSIITFTSAETYKNSGDWSGLIFDKGSSNGCIIDNCLIEYGGDNNYMFSNIAFNETHGNVTVSNTLISKAKGYGIFIDSLSTPNLINNTFNLNFSGEQYQQ